LSFWAAFGCAFSGKCSVTVGRSRGNGHEWTPVLGFRVRDDLENSLE